MIHAAITGIRYDTLQCGDSPVVWTNRVLDLSSSIRDMYVGSGADGSTSSSSPTKGPNSATTTISDTISGDESNRIADSSIHANVINIDSKLLPDNQNSLKGIGQQSSSSSSSTASTLTQKIITPLKSISKGFKLPSTQNLDVNRFLFHEEDYTADSRQTPVKKTSELDTASSSVANAIQDISSQFSTSADSTDSFRPSISEHRVKASATATVIDDISSSQPQQRFSIKQPRTSFEPPSSFFNSDPDTNTTAPTSTNVNTPSKQTGGILSTSTSTKSINRPQRKSFSPAKDTSVPIDDSDTTVTPHKDLSTALDAIHCALESDVNIDINDNGSNDLVCNLNSGNTNNNNSSNSRRTTLVNSSSHSGAYRVNSGKATSPPSLRRSLSLSPSQKGRKSVEESTSSPSMKSSAVVTESNKHGPRNSSMGNRSPNTRERSSHSPSARSSILPGNRGRLVSGSNNSKGIHNLWRKHSDPIISNFNVVIQGINHLFGSIDKTTTNNTMPSSSTSSTSTKVSELPFVILDEATLVELESVESSDQFQDILFSRIAQSNAYLSRKWTLFVSSLPQYMPQLASKLKISYSRIIKQFWKRQLFVHFARYVYLITISSFNFSNSIIIIYF